MRYVRAIAMTSLSYRGARLMADNEPESEFKLQSQFRKLAFDINSTTFTCLR